MTGETLIEQTITTSVTIEPTKPKSKPKIKTRTYEWCNDGNHAVRGESALWAAVITQAMMDALSKATNSEARYHKNEAINWLTGNSRNFITVCHFAGMDPDYVRKKAKRSIANPQNWRADAGKGKRYLERKAYRKQHAAPQDEPAVTSVSETVVAGPWGV